MHQTVDARLINGLWIMVSYIWRQNKTRKKVCWLQIYAGIISRMAHPNVVGLNQCIDELILWFYFTFIFIIEFVLMVFNMKFVSDGL